MFVNFKTELPASASNNSGVKSWRYLSTESNESERFINLKNNNSGGQGTVRVQFRVRTGSCFIYRFCDMSLMNSAGPCCNLRLSHVLILLPVPVRLCAIGFNFWTADLYKTRNPSPAPPLQLVAISRFFDKKKATHHLQSARAQGHVAVEVFSPTSPRAHWIGPE